MFLSCTCPGKSLPFVCIFILFSFMLNKFTTSPSTIFFYLLLFYINCIQKPSINTYILSLSAHILPTYLYIRENCLNIIFLSVCLSHRWGGISFPFPDINPVCLCVSLHRGSTVYRTTSDVRHCHLSLANVIVLRRH